jgi:hypothetical protein
MTTGPTLGSDIAAAYYNRLGNMAIVKATQNTIAGNSSFAIKKPVLAASGYLLTSEIGQKNAWDIEDITERQKHLAALAIKTWSLTTP